jgi:hypothetical protein
MFEKKPCNETRSLRFPLELAKELDQLVDSEDSSFTQVVVALVKLGLKTYKQDLEQGKNVS